MRWTRPIAAVAALVCGLGCSDGSFRGIPSREVAGAVAWHAAIEEDDATALLVTPAVALGASRTYAVILTRGIRDLAGRALSASDDFAAALDLTPSRDGGPIALWTDDLEDPANPYPD